MFGFLRRFGSRIDEMVTRIENHEALVESAARELEALVERGLRELERSRGTIARLREAVAEEREAATRWRERAVRELDEVRGVECLRRSKRSRARTLELEERLRVEETVEQRLLSRAELLRHELAEFRDQETLLRARQSRNERLSPPGSPAAAPGLELGELLERWETHVRETELSSGSAPFSIDDLSEELGDSAEQAALVLELRELKERMR
jgi:hypothetical protein